MTTSKKFVTMVSIRTPTRMLVHCVRAVPTKTGYLYYFDAQGGAYIWWKGKLILQHPKKLMNKQMLLHNKNGGYLTLTKSSRSRGKNRRGTIKVHRGVAFAFPEICGLPSLIQNQVDHINNQMYDNRAVNLQWLSPSENTRKSKQSTIRRSRSFPIGIRINNQQ